MPFTLFLLIKLKNPAKIYPVEWYQWYNISTTMRIVGWCHMENHKESSYITSAYIPIYLYLVCCMVYIIYLYNVYVSKQVYLNSTEQKVILSSQTPKSRWVYSSFSSPLLHLNILLLRSKPFSVLTNSLCLYFEHQWKWEIYTFTPMAKFCVVW